MTTHVDPMTDDELARHADPLDDSGTGTLDTARGNLPLDRLDLRATITGLATETVLTQGFQNPYDEPLEATYIFPLPDRAAVTALRMETPGRVVDAILKERGAARADYEHAISAGQRASIAEEERPGVFTMRVGNIMPGERVTIRLTLAGRLPFEDGAATYRFPLVVAPRYIPGVPISGASVGDGTALDTDLVPDASRISPPVLLPHFPNPVRLSAFIDIDPGGLPLERVSSSLHVTTIDPGDDGTCRVALAPGDRVNRDFVLRLGFGSDAVVGSVAMAADDTGKTFACTVLPPTITAVARPRDVVLVLDRSGSMDGWKMVAARRAAARIVDTFSSADRFAVLSFDHQVETPAGLPDGLVPATDRNRFRAIEHLAGLIARGGTEMHNPLLQATGLLTDTGRDRVIVLVTDGQVGNEDHILHDLSPRVSGIRVHTVGVDTAVNEAFLRRLAGLAGGRCELVESEDRLDEAMRQIHQRIASPLVTDLRVTSSDMAIDADTVAPAGLPDLYPGAPIVITGRCAHGGSLTVSGRRPDGTAWQETIAAGDGEHPGLRAVWARTHVRDLEDRYVTAQSDGRISLSDLERRIVTVSLAHQVLCRFTAFVAVDSRVVNAGGDVHRVTQPVEQPAGWNMPVAAPMPAGAYQLQAFTASASIGGAEAGTIPVVARMPGMMPPPPPGPARFGRTRAKHTKVSRELKYREPVGVDESETMVPAGPNELRAFAERALERLRQDEKLPFDDRVRVLAEIADELAPHLAGGDDALRDLATALRATPADDDALDGLWQRAVDVFQAFLGVSRRRPFWKR